MEPNQIIAIWDVRGTNLPDMESEARSDALEFLGDTTGINIYVVHCNPVKITNGRVEAWKGWAIISWGYVEPELLSHTVMDHQWFRMRSAEVFSSQLHSPPTT